MKHLILIGAPGSGKGTQAEKLVLDKGYKHVSTGDLLRAEVAKETDLGIRVKKLMESGQLVGDDVVLELLRANIDLSAANFIFDGYPRNIEQAKALDSEILFDSDYMAIYFKIDTEILVERLTNRRVCKNCSAIYNLVGMPPKKEGICDKCGAELFHRKDDHEDVIRNRISVYNATIKPMLDYYAGRNKLSEVDACGGKDEAYEDIVNILS